MEDILKNAASQADAAEVYILRERETPVQFERGEIQRISQKNTLGVALRLIREGRMGFSTSTTLEDRGLVERALATADFGESQDLKFPSKDFTAVESHDSHLASLTAEELIDDAHNILDRLAALAPSTPIDLGLSQKEVEIEVGNTSGFQGKYSRTGLGVSVGTRSAQGFREVYRSFSSGRYFTFPEKWLEELGRRHQQAQNRIGVPTGKMPVIFSPGTFGALVMRLIAAIDGTSLNAGTSPLEGRLGEQLFDSRLNIREDPHLSWGLHTCPFDDEGVATRPRDLIKEGRLEGYLYDLKSAGEAGVESTGNGFKRGLFASGASQKPHPTPSNLIISGGAIPLADLIAEIDEGLLIEGVMGAHTGNIQAGEYSLNINPGFYIREGRIVGRATDAMVSGNIYETLTDIGALSAEQGILAMFGPMGYGPYVMLPGASVTGGG